MIFSQTKKENSVNIPQLQNIDFLFLMHFIDVLTQPSQIQNHLNKK